MNKIIKILISIPIYKLLRTISLNYRKIYYFALFLLICTVLLLISIPQYERLEKNFTTSNEITRIYEKWLLVKNETVRYLFMENRARNPYDLINAVSNYEIAMRQIFFDERIFNMIINDLLLFEEVLKMIFIWQDIQLTLVISIFFNDDIDLFAYQIFSYIIETDHFEISIRNTINLINQHLAESMRRNWIMFMASLCFIVFLILLLRSLFYNYFEIRKKEKEVRKLSESIMEARDKERIRIAADFHDVIVQDLLVIKNQCNEMISDNKYDNIVINEIEKIKTITDRNIKSVREISFNLRPPELANSLCESIKNLLMEVELKKDIIVNYHPLGLDSYVIDQNLEIIVYRLICEAVNNVLKHAHASEITIRIILFFPNIVIKIEDNGVGFQPSEIVRTEEHMGIQGMKDRVMLVGGKMEIKPGKETGTIVIFKIPCKGLVKEK
ncbi:MAG: ATP-binding protein [Spirochaetes bacterium]|nr:ATP-binding protein [Spirochaetota bacterium]